MNIIGIDPDSKASGVAWYKCGKLISIQNMGLIELWKFLEQRKSDSFRGSEYALELHIEDLNANRCSSFNWQRSGKPKPVLDKINGKISEGVGKCKQTQTEIERIAIGLSIRVAKHKVSSKWKSAQAGKAEFKMVTGWLGRSNEDTRSAAYFGFLGLK